MWLARPSSSLRVVGNVCRELVESFKCGQKTEAKEGEEELSANAVIRREYVKLGSMT